MGDFMLVVTAAGNHGCEREKRDGAVVIGCERPGCPDCISREMVRRLKRTGATVKEAVLTHWPGTTEQVEDNLLTGIRSGSFR